MDILPNVGERPRAPNGIISQEEANQLVTDALDADMSEPEQLVKLLVILHDNSQDGYLQEALYRLIRAAYNFSLVHSFSLQDYMAVIREGRDPLKEARTREQELSNVARKSQNDKNLVGAGVRLHNMQREKQNTARS